MTSLHKDINRDVLLKGSKKIKKDNKANKDGHVLTRKIVKNFGRAIISFVCNSKSSEIIMQLCNNDPETYQRLILYLKESKTKIEGSRRLKQLLTVDLLDS